MAQTDKYIVFIANAIEPYGYEIVNVLAYPPGFKYRFRFDEEWVQDEIKSQIADLTDREAYIVLRDFDKAKLFPIRLCTICDA